MAENGKLHLVQQEPGDTGGCYDNESFVVKSVDCSDHPTSGHTENGHLPVTNSSDTENQPVTNGVSAVVEKSPEFRQKKLDDVNLNIESSRDLKCSSDSKLPQYSDGKMLNSEENQRLSLPDDAVINMDTGRVRISKNHGSSKDSQEKEKIPLKDLSYSSSPADHEKALEAGAQELLHRNGLSTEDSNGLSYADSYLGGEKQGNGTGSGFEEYFVPVNTHKKFLRGEKLYLTKDSKKVCYKWRTVLICGLLWLLIIIAVVVGTLIATGTLMPESDSTPRHKVLSHTLPNRASVAGHHSSGQHTASKGPHPTKDSPTTTLNPSHTTPPVRLTVPVTNVSQSEAAVPNAMVGEFTIVNENFSDDLLDNTTEDFLSLATHLESQLNRILKRNGVHFEGLKILDFRLGSIVVRFLVLWNDKQHTAARKVEEIMKYHLLSNSNQLLGFLVDSNSVNFTDVVDECRLENDKCPYRCFWSYYTMSKTCTCPENQRYVAHDNACQELEVLKAQTIPVTTTTMSPKAEPTISDMATLNMTHDTSTLQYGTTEQPVRSLGEVTTTFRTTTEVSTSPLTNSTISTYDVTTTGHPMSLPTSSSPFSSTTEVILQDAIINITTTPVSTVVTTVVSTTEEVPTTRPMVENETNPTTVRTTTESTFPSHLTTIIERILTTEASTSNAIQVIGDDATTTSPSATPEPLTTTESPSTRAPTRGPSLRSFEMSIEPEIVTTESDFIEVFNVTDATTTTRTFTITVNDGEEVVTESLSTDLIPSNDTFPSETTFTDVPEEETITAMTDIIENPTNITVVTEIPPSLTLITDIPENVTEAVEVTEFSSDVTDATFNVTDIAESLGNLTETTEVPDVFNVTDLPTDSSEVPEENIPTELLIRVNESFGNANDKVENSTDIVESSTLQDATFTAEVELTSIPVVVEMLTTPPTIPTTVMPMENFTLASEDHNVTVVTLNETDLFEVDNVTANAFSVEMDNFTTNADINGTEGTTTITPFENYTIGIGENATDFRIFEKEFENVTVLPFENGTMAEEKFEEVTSSNVTTAALESNGTSSAYATVPTFGFTDEYGNFSTLQESGMGNSSLLNITIGLSCREDQFECKSLNKCMNNSFLCDGIEDCPPLDSSSSTSLDDPAHKFSDETDCVDNCHLNFKCHNSSMCIMSEAQCDGIWDCADGSDERNCTPTECAKHEVMCSDGSACIKPGSICDWKYNCRDRSDEASCVERTTCEKTMHFFCNDGLCIPWSLKCDGNFDCKDKEDEGNCTCLPEEFKCNDGKCLKSSSRCDGHQDCLAAEDEMGCVNVDEQGMVITFEPYSGTWSLLCADDWTLDDGHYLCQELGFGHALSTERQHVNFNGTWMAMNRDNLTDTSLWTERVTFAEICTSNLAATASCEKFECGNYSGLLHRRKRQADDSLSSPSNQWPFIAYISTFQSHQSCLSEILTPIWLITSAECLLSFGKEQNNGSDWYVRTNMANQQDSDAAQNHEVQKIILHPHSSKFRSLILRDYDVALIRLKHSLVFSDKIGAICLPEEQVPSGITCFSGVLGPEKPRTPLPPSPVFSSSALMVLDRESCNVPEQYNEQINQRMICTKSSDGQKICDNDGGTPLMCLSRPNRWYLAGMLTYQRFCTIYSWHPAVFSNLFSMKPFVDQVIGQKQYEVTYDSNMYVIVPPTTEGPTTTLPPPEVATMPPLEMAITVPYLEFAPTVYHDGITTLGNVTEVYLGETVTPTPAGIGDFNISEERMDAMGNFNTSMDIEMDDSNKTVLVSMTLKGNLTFDNGTMMNIEEINGTMMNIEEINGTMMNIGGTNGTLNASGDVIVPSMDLTFPNDLVNVTEAAKDSSTNFTTESLASNVTESPVDTFLWTNESEPFMNYREEMVNIMNDQPPVEQNETLDSMSVLKSEDVLLNKSLEDFETPETNLSVSIPDNTTTVTMVEEYVQMDNISTEIPTTTESFKLPSNESSEMVLGKLVIMPSDETTTLTASTTLPTTLENTSVSTTTMSSVSATTTESPPMVTNNVSIIADASSTASTVAKISVTTTEMPSISTTSMANENMSLAFKPYPLNKDKNTWKAVNFTESTTSAILEKVTTLPPIAADRKGSKSAKSENLIEFSTTTTKLPKLSEATTVVDKAMESSTTTYERTTLTTIQTPPPRILEKPLLKKDDVSKIENLLTTPDTSTGQTTVSTDSTTSLPNIEAEAFGNSGRTKMNCGNWDYEASFQDFTQSGHLETLKRWPSIGVLKTGSGSCISSVISPHYVVTSLYCLASKDNQLNADNWKFVHSNPKGHTVEKIVLYNLQKDKLVFMENDVALVKVRHTMLSNSSTMMSSCLPENPVRNNSRCFSISLESKSADGEEDSVQFNSVPVAVTPGSECFYAKMHHERISKSLMCIKYPKDTLDPCKVDNGAPLLCYNQENRWEIQGISAPERSCKPNLPALYNNVYAASNWIMTTISEKEE